MEQKKKKLETLVEKKNLKNIIFKPFIGRDDYASLLKACDVGLVSLSAKNKTPVVPGKILGYMAASLPVVAFLNKESDGHEIIRESSCGFSVVSDDLSNIVSVITEAYNTRDQSTARGKAGFEYAKKHFSKEACVDAMVSYIE